MGQEAEAKKAEALKCYVEAQKQVQEAQRKLLEISPVVASSKPYETGQKLELAIRQLISQINMMRVT